MTGIIFHMPSTTAPATVTTATAVFLVLLGAGIDIANVVANILGTDGAGIITFGIITTSDKGALARVHIPLDLADKNGVSLAGRFGSMVDASTGASFLSSTIELRTFTPDGVDVPAGEHIF